jgi:glycosyltransferase involved in cell wall biosynthesis
MPAADPRVTMLVRNPMTHDSRVEKEAGSLARAGYAVTVLAEAAEGLPEAEERDGYRIERVARPATRIRGLRLLAHQRRLEARLVATRPQILHAHDSDALVPVSRAASRLHVPFVLDAHELWLGRQPRGRGRLYRGLFRAYYGLIERRHVPLAAAIVTVSPVIARHLEQRYGVEDVALVPNYPELEPPRTIELRDLSGGERIPRGATIVLHVGSAMPGRGVEQLVKAMRDVPEAHLVLLGPGPAGEELLRNGAEFGLGERMHAIPPVSTADVVAAASSATVGVAPIIPDTPNNAASMPNKLFQYLAAGLAVVVSDLPQLREVVEESGTGTAVDTSDPARLGRAIASILADGPRLASMRASARAAVEERYNWDRAAASLLAVYRRLGDVSEPAPA